MAKKTENHASPPTVNLMEEVIRSAKKKYFQDIFRLPVDPQTLFLSFLPFRLELSEATAVFSRLLKRSASSAAVNQMRGVLWEKMLGDGSPILKDPEHTLLDFLQVMLPRERHPLTLGRVAMHSDGKVRAADIMVAGHMKAIFYEPMAQQIHGAYWPWVNWWRMAENGREKYAMVMSGLYHFCTVPTPLNKKRCWLLLQHFEENPADREQMFETLQQEIKYSRKGDIAWEGLWRALVLIATPAEEHHLYDILVKKLGRPGPKDQWSSCLSEVTAVAEWEPKDTRIRTALKHLLQEKLESLKILDKKGNLLYFTDCSLAKILQEALTAEPGQTFRPDMDSGTKNDVTEILFLLEQGWRKKEGIHRIATLYEQGRVTGNCLERDILDRELEALLRHEKDEMVFLQVALLAVRHADESEQLPAKKVWCILLEQEVQAGPGTWPARMIPLIRRGLLIRELERCLENGMGENGMGENGMGGKEHEGTQINGGERKRGEIGDNTTWLRGLRSLVHAFPDDHLAFESLRSPATRSAIGVRIWDDVWKTVQKSAGMDNLFSRRKKLEFRCPPGGFRGGLPAWSPPALFKPPSFGPTSFQPTGQPVGQPGVASDGLFRVIGFHIGNIPHQGFPVLDGHLPDSGGKSFPMHHPPRVQARSRATGRFLRRGTATPEPSAKMLRSRSGA